VKLNTDDAVLVENVTKTFKYNKPKGLPNILKSLTHQYSDNRLVALENISFNVSKGETLGIIGVNASGKTTLLRIIAGIYKPDFGNIHVAGKLAPLLQIGVGFHSELTASENITMSAMLYGFSKEKIKEIINPVIEFAELQEFVNMRLKHFSSGMKARLAFSIAMQIDPDILLVDEILAVGDLAFREKSLNAFLSFKEKKKTILYTTHALGSLAKYCDRVLLLDKGKLITVGQPRDVIKTYRERLHLKDDNE